jgi:hypothetical protein
MDWNAFPPILDLVTPFDFTKRTSLHMFLQAAPSSERAYKWHSYGASLKFPNAIDFRYTFVGLLPTNTTNPPNIAMPDNYLSWQDYPNGGVQWPIGETAKLFFIFNYALQETPARWIFRAYDDVLMRSDLLLPYMMALEEEHNPLIEFVIRGACIFNGLLYAQSGVGILFSRRAVEKLAPLGNHTIWRFWEDHDDKRFGHLLDDLKINAGAITSSAFVDGAWDENDSLAIVQNNFTGLRPCPNPDTIDQIGCQKVLAPVRQIVFYHIRTYLNVREKTRNLMNLSNAPSFVHFWYPGGDEPLLCQRHGPPVSNKRFPLV